MTTKGLISVGISVGSLSEPSGICVSELEYRDVPPGCYYGAEHYLIRALQRIPAGASYPSIADRAAELVSRLSEYTSDWIRITVDATGKGPPLVDLFRSRIEGNSIYSAYFNFGDQISEAANETITIGKAWLVTRLVTSLQASRLHLPRSQDAEILADELNNYQIEIDPNANNRYGAFKVGTKDELVTALGLTLIPVRRAWIY